VTYTELMRPVFERAAHISVSRKDEFRARIVFEDKGGRLKQYVGPFLIGQSSREEHHGVGRTYRVTHLNGPRIYGNIKVMVIDPVINSAYFPIRNIVHPHNLSLKSVRNRNNPIRAKCAMPFMVSYPRGTASIKIVPASAIFRRVHREYPFSASTLLDPDHRVGSEPIVGVDNVKMSPHIVLEAEYRVDERAAHVVDVLDNIGMAGVGDPVIIHALDPFILRMVPFPHARKEMDFMPFPLQGGRELCHMRADAACADRMKGFPRKNGDFHQANAFFKSL